MVLQRKAKPVLEIISAVYGKELATKAAKQELFETAGIAITDIFLKISRKNNSNLDQNLVIEEYNDKAIREALTDSKIISVFFTSKFVEKHFRLKFPEIDFAESLPSPSPRFARMSLEAKIEHYKAKLPKL